MNIYVTADDTTAVQTGGGKVVHEESEAFIPLGDFVVQDRKCFPPVCLQDVWKCDEFAADRLRRLMPSQLTLIRPPRLAHFYAGTFTKTIQFLKNRGYKVSYTAAAHSIQTSKEEHEKLGIPFDYPHLTDPDLWGRYVGGYLMADVVVCPSNHSAEVMRSYGCKNVKVIHHGVDIPDAPIAPLPETFTVGYLGSCGAPDKGLVYLLQAWKELDLPDAVLKLGGRDAQSEWVNHLVRRYGGGWVEQVGWVENPSDFYNSLSCYTQPSASEGFGLEVLEAQAHGRRAFCSDGAGAADCVNPTCVFKKGDVKHLADLILTAKESPSERWEGFLGAHRHAADKYAWDRQRALYTNLWKEMLE